MLRPPQRILIVLLSIFWIKYEFFNNYAFNKILDYRSFFKIVLIIKNFLSNSINKKKIINIWRNLLLLFNYSNFFKFFQTNWKYFLLHISENFCGILIKWIYGKNFLWSARSHLKFNDTYRWAKCKGLMFTSVLLTVCMACWMHN